jgi:hypothetical protein
LRGAAAGGESAARGARRAARGGAIDERSGARRWRTSGVACGSQLY